MAGLARMANRDHRFVEIQPGDTVIVSASPIPGNEEYVSRTIDNLFKAGANVYYHTIKRAHVSGHASQEELKLMLGLTKPQVTSSRSTASSGCRSSTAASRSRPASRPRTSSSSRTASRSRSSPTARPAAARPVAAGYVFVDGLSVGDVGEIVLRDRRALANDGMFMVVVTVDKQTGNVVGRPEIITRGFVHLNEKDPIMDEAIDRILESRPEPRRPHQRDRPAQEPDQGRRVALPLRADEAAADGLPGRGRGLMATRRRTTRRSTRDGAARAHCRGPCRRRAGGRPLDRRDRPARARRRHADRARAARPGRADRLVARFDRAVVRDRPLAAAVPPARRRLVRRVGPGQAAGLRLGHDAARDRDRVSSASSARSRSST